MVLEPELSELIVIDSIVKTAVLSYSILAYGASRGDAVICGIVTVLLLQRSLEVDVLQSHSVLQDVEGVVPYNPEFNDLLCDGGRIAQVVDALGIAVRIHKLAGGGGGGNHVSPTIQLEHDGVLEMPDRLAVEVHSFPH